MLTAGIDIGAKSIKIVALQDSECAAKSMILAGHDIKTALEKAWGDIEARSGIKVDEIGNIVATGAGRKESLYAASDITEVSAVAKGAMALDRSVRTVIDVGAEGGRAIKIDNTGKVIDFAVNEKCAAGTGAFIEAMARALEVTIEELGALSLLSTQTLTINAQCAVFAESELVTLVHSQTPKPDMARAVHYAIVDRIISMARRVGLEQSVMLVGGVARNIGFVESFKRELDSDVIIPEDPEYVGAYGAAVAAGR